MHDLVTTYEPDNSLKQGYWVIFVEIFNEFKENRWLTYQLFKRDFFALYKQSFIGVFWAFLLPFFSIGTFVLLNRSGIFSVGNIHVPYPIYAVLGLTFWQIFSTGLIASSNALVNAGSMIVKINFSKKSLIIASAGQAVIAFLIQVVLACILFLSYQVFPTLYILFLPLFLLPIILLTLGLGFILSLLNGVVRDIGNALSTLITFLMFLTPILYAKPTTGLLGNMTPYNPLYYLIAVPRDIILTGTTHHVGGFILATLFACALFIICLLAFHLTETRVAERI
jgi:lipopolysaccharide transport system permease protein